MAMITCPECGKEISDKTDKCPNCGCPINTNLKNEESIKENGVKVPKKKSSALSIWACVLAIFTCTSPIAVILAIIDLATNNKEKKHGGSIFAIIYSVIIFIIAIMIGLGGNSNSTDTNDNQQNANEEIVYIEEADFVKVYSDPDSYKGKYMKFVGKVFSVEKDEEAVYLQVYEDIENYENNTIVKYNNSDFDINEDEYVEIEGKIVGKFKGENLLGGTILAPQIEAVKIEKKSYMEAVHPTIKEVKVSQTVENNGYSLTLDKIEFAEKQTRLYFTFENNGAAEYSLSTYSAKVQQGASQYEVEYDYNAEYEELKDSILTGVTSSGVITFGGMKSDEAITVYLEGYDNENYESQEFTFEVTP